jgi:hypothetical protein
MHIEAFKCFLQIILLLKDNYLPLAMDIYPKKLLCLPQIPAFLEIHKGGF